MSGFGDENGGRKTVTDPPSPPPPVSIGTKTPPSLLVEEGEREGKTREETGDCDAEGLMESKMRTGVEDSELKMKGGGEGDDVC